MAGKLVDEFVAQVIANSDYTDLDAVYLKNRVLALVGEDGADRTTTKEAIIDLKDELVALAQANGKVGASFNEGDTLGAELMNFITPDRVWLTNASGKLIIRIQVKPSVIFMP